MKVGDQQGSASSFPLEGSQQRYNEWLRDLRKSALLPAERLIPTLPVDVPRTLPPLMMARENLTAPEKDGLIARINSLSPWGYTIQLAPGVMTGDPKLLERTVYRAHLIRGAVMKLAGTSQQLSVLDLACNHGYFGLQCAHEGFKSTGIDLREGNIAKARLLKEHFRAPDANFFVKNVYHCEGGFDIVMNLGLLYHVTDPYALLKKTYELCTAFAVVDTVTHLSPVSAFIQRTNKHSAHHAEGQFSVEYHPTYRALLDLMHAVGFKQLVEVVPKDSPGRAEHPLYERLERRCIVGFK